MLLNVNQGSIQDSKNVLLNVNQRHEKDSKNVLLNVNQRAQTGYQKCVT